MPPACGIAGAKSADNLSGAVDAVRRSPLCAGDIDGGVRTVVEDKSVGSAVVGVVTHDAARNIDTGRHRGITAREIESRDGVRIGGEGREVMNQNPEDRGEQATKGRGLQLHWR